MTEAVVYSRSARALSQGDSFVPAFLAFLWYPANSLSVHRKRATLFAGSGMGGLPRPRLACFMALIMRLQIILDKPPTSLYSVATLNKEIAMKKTITTAATILEWGFFPAALITWLVFTLSRVAV